MAPRTKLGVALALGIAVAGIASACGLDDTVITGPGGGNGATGGDATIGADGSSGDGGGIVVLPDGAVVLPDGAILLDADLDDATVALDAGSLPDAIASDGGACPPGQSLCPSSGLCVSDCYEQCDAKLSCSDGGAASCVSDCTACGTQTIQCFRCGSESSFNPNGTCEDPTSGSSCIQDPFYVHCACLGYDVSQCPGPTQVCRPTLILGVGACVACGESSTKGDACKAGGKCDTKNDTCH